LVCPRCEQHLLAAVAARGTSVREEVSDAGIALDSYDQSSAGRPPPDLQAQEQLQEQLRQIARKLGSVQRKNSFGHGMARGEALLAGSQPRLRADEPHAVPPLTTAFLEEKAVGPSAQRCDARVAAIGYQARGQVPREATSWLLSLLLLAGAFSLACGVGLLTHATMTGLDQTGPGSLTWQGGLAWQGGLTITLVGEGMLIVGLTWMAIRLWRNGRRVNHQLQGVDRQLAELQYQAGVELGMRSSSSSAFYDHFARGASSQVLLASLRGGLDQLAKRME
jgi:hypothetical protein